LERSKVTVIVIGVIVVTVASIVIFTFSQSGPIINPIVVSTGKSYYQTGAPATIMVNIHVKTEVYKEGEKVELQIVNGNRTVYASQTITNVQPNVNMTFPLKLAGQEAIAGEYWVFASYRGFDSQTSFLYEGFKPNAVNCSMNTFCTYTVKAGNNTYPINLSFNGTIENMIANIETRDLTIELNSDKPTSLQIAIPRAVVDARTGEDGRSGEDDHYAVFVDEELAEVDEIPIQAREWTIALGIHENPEKYRILIIPVDEGIEEVVIVGTWPI
jgi:hypothetical protein